MTYLEKALDEKQNKTDFNNYDNTEYWFWLLQDALQKSGLQDMISLDFITNVGTRPSLGKTPSFDQRAQYIRRKAKNGWRQYEYEEVETAQKPQKSPSNLSASEVENVDTRKWAYVFLLGGAHSQKKNTEYLAGLYSVVAAAHQLRNLGSKSDIVLMVQIASDSPLEKLSDFEEEILQKMNIQILYIPKFADASLECFYSRKYISSYERENQYLTLLLTVAPNNSLKPDLFYLDASYDGKIQNTQADGLFSRYVFGL